MVAKDDDWLDRMRDPNIQKKEIDKEKSSRQTASTDYCANRTRFDTQSIDLTVFSLN